MPQRQPNQEMLNMIRLKIQVEIVAIRVHPLKVARILTVRIARKIAFLV
jgi:hypothetical protein